MLEKMPKNYVDHEVKEALNRMGPLLPMSIFLRQEIDRMQRVLRTVLNIENLYTDSNDIYIF
jgi:dynein heavy chain